MMIRAGILKGWQLKKLSIFLYLAELLIAMYVGVQVAYIFGQEAALQVLMQGFDFTIWHDFLVHHGDVMDVFIYQVLIYIPVFFALAIFTTGGVMYCGRIGKDTWKDFWAGGSRYFYRFGINFLLFSSLVVLWSTICLGPLVFLVPYFLESCACEKWLLRIVGLILTIYFFGLMVFINASAISKSYIVESKTSVMPVFRKGLRQATVNIGSYIGYFLFFLLSTLLVVWLYHGMSALVTMNTALAIVVVGFIQQVIIMCRILLRTMYLYTVQARIRQEIEK